MIISMIKSMKMNLQTNAADRARRITVTLPGYLADQLARTLPKRTISKFVAEAVSDKLGDTATGNAVEAFFKLSKKFSSTKPVSTEAILRAIHKGRT